MPWRNRCACKISDSVTPLPTNLLDEYEPAVNVIQADRDNCRQQNEQSIPVADTQCGLHRGLDLTGLALPGAQSKNRHLLAIVQGDCGVVHGGVLAVQTHDCK